MPLQKLNRTSVNSPALPTTKMMVFGGGNFVRAFILYFLNEYNKSALEPFGAVVVKVTPGDYLDWKDQDGLYHVLTKGLKEGQVIDKSDLISCVTDILAVYEDWELWLKNAENPSIQFLVNNVTESGLVFKEESFNDEIPDTFPAKLTKWLLRRFQYFEGDASKGCILMPCELIENNADLLKSFIKKYIYHWQLSSDFEKWLDESCIFCNTLVDRIVPGVNKNHLSTAQEKVGYADKLITEGEPYHIFVIEADDKVRSALPWHQTPGLQIIYTKDLSVYRIKKIRILNGAHSSLVPVGLLYGLEIVREVLEDDLLSKYVEHLIYQEIIPILPLDKQTLVDYAKDTLDRFRNPFLHHKLETISLNSFSKARVRIIPTIKEFYNKNGTFPKGTILAFSSMILLYRGYYNDLKFAINDDTYIVETMKTFWSEAKTDSIPDQHQFTQLLSDPKLWGEDLSQIVGLQETIMAQLNGIFQNGMKHEIAQILLEM